MDRNRIFASMDEMPLPKEYQVSEAMQSPEELSQIARDLYQKGPYLLRKMMHFRIQICPFERLLSHVPEGAKVLDVGCGAGLFLSLLAATVPNIRGWGFDSSKQAIAVAKHMVERVKLKEYPAEIQIEWLDVNDPWPNEFFQVVSLIDVLHHVPAAFQRKVIDQAIEHLEPGGILLYKDMADAPLFQAGMNRLHDLVLARQWIQYLPIEHVEQWAAQGGLRLVHTENCSRFWYRHEMRVFQKS